MKKYLLALFLVLGLTLGAAPSPAEAHVHPERPRFQACMTEDGGDSAYPCVWDGRHQGNKVGRSWLINERGVARYITHKRAHKLLKKWRRYVRHVNNCGSW